METLFNSLAPGLGQAGFGEGVLVGGAGFGFAAGCGEEVALDGVGGSAPATGLFGGVDASEGLEGILVLT